MCAFKYFYMKVEKCVPCSKLWAHFGMTKFWNILDLEYEEKLPGLVVMRNINFSKRNNENGKHKTKFIDL